MSIKYIGSEGATALANGPEAGHCTGLQQLDLGNNGIGDEGGQLAVALAFGHCTGLRQLNLGGNSIGAEGAGRERRGQNAERGSL